MNVKGIVEIIIGILILIGIFIIYSFDTYPCGVSASGDQWVVIGYMSSGFPLFYGISVLLLAFGYKDIN